MISKRKKWIIPHADPEKIDSLSRALRMSPVTARLLVNRGLEKPDRARRFLEPNLHQLSDPSLDSGVRAAARFLKEAIKGRKHITIYGDFDADGICASALMVRALQAAGASVDFYVPHRFDEGYGLNVSALEEISRRGSDVLITVDCGIGANEQIKFANEMGLEVIITDHHQQRGELPPARQLLNPHLENCSIGYEYLSGVGVAFKLAWALGQSFGRDGSVESGFKETLVDLLPLVAIGTVADLVPMRDENRAYVNYGLKLLSGSSLPGLKALLQACGIAGKSTFSTYNIGYQLAPRLNAAGRMADARAAIEMLVTENSDKARQIASQMEQHNRKRQSIQRSISDEAMEMARETHDIENCSCIVLSSADWHPGVVGLVASRLAESFSRPAFVFYEKNGIARGSARSIPGLHLFNAVSQCSSLLNRFGGHEGAAGLTLPAAQLESFKENISTITQEFIGPEPPVPQLQLEGEIALDELSKPAVEELGLLEPYGEGNPEPLFAARGLEVVGNPQLVGSRRSHLAFLARQNQRTIRVIAFGKADWLEAINQRGNGTFSLAFQPQLNTYGNNYNVELRAEDMQWDDETLIEKEGH